MRRFFSSAIISAALLSVGGCSTNVEKLDANAPLPQPAPVAPAARSPVAASGGATAPAATSTATGSHEEQLQQVEKLEAEYKQKPDAALKAKLVKAKYDYASNLMEDSNVPPMRKYRPALKQFNEVLKLDPSHQGAAQKKKLIEDIYRGMGMPIPQS